MTRTIAVIGGGAVGLTAAYDLAAAGENVTVFERGGIGSGSTGRAAGVLYDAYAGDVDAKIGKRSIERFRELSGEGGFEFHETPYVWFARAGDDRRGNAIREHVAGMRRHGIDVELLDGESLGEFAPAIATEDIGVAALARNAGWTDPSTYAETMATKARKAGVEIRTDAPAAVAEGGVLADGEGEPFETVVVAAGAHTKRVLKEVGRSIAMKPYRVQALVLDAEIETPMGYDSTGGFYFRPHPDGLLVGDGTEERESDPEKWGREANAAFVESSIGRASERFGLAEPTVEGSWAGLCTATPDGNPLLGWLEEGQYVATGWQGHGFMRAPALGERIAREIRGGSGIEAFAPTRFTNGEEFPIVEGMAL